MKLLASRGDRRKDKAGPEHEARKAHERGDEDVQLSMWERAKRTFFFWNAGPGGGP